MEGWTCNLPDRPKRSSFGTVSLGTPLAIDFSRVDSAGRSRSVDPAARALQSILEGRRGAASFPSDIKGVKRELGEHCDVRGISLLSAATDAARCDGRHRSSSP
jgi:hypothetical protein